MKLPPALLERWMRRFYFDTELDLASSGVAPITLEQLCRIAGVDVGALGALVFRDGRTQGDLGLRRSIADRWGSGDPDRVIVTHGSSEAIYLVMTTLLEPGDEVVALAPIYQQLSAVAEGVGATVRTWQLRSEDGFSPRVDELNGLLTPASRMLIVNFPHNPTGATLSRPELAAVVAAAERVGAYLLWDAAFAELVYDGFALPDPGTAYGRVISLGTLSKAYGLPGLRVGWCIAPPEVVAGCVERRDYTTLHLSPLVELLARAAVKHADRLLSHHLPRVGSNLESLHRWIDDRAGEVEWSPPQGGVSAFLRLAKVNDTITFCRRLAEERGTLLVPGECFGHPGYVRLGFGGTRGDFDSGLARLAMMLEDEVGSVLSERKDEEELPSCPSSS